MIAAKDESSIERIHEKVLGETDVILYSCSNPEVRWELRAEF